MSKEVGPQIIEQIIELKKRGLHISEIASRFNISDSTVLKYSQHIPHPNKKSLIPLPDSAKGLSIKKAEILGFLCSEGNDNNFIDNHIEYDKRRKKLYVRNMNKQWINFSNTDLAILKRFLYLMEMVYDYPLRYFKKGTVYIKRKEVVKDLRRYSLFGSRRWSVPKELFKKQYRNQAKRFIRAYFDGDGSVDYKWNKRITLDSVNKNSLSKLNKLLLHLGISTRYYIYKNRSRITIKDVIKYKKTIGFFHLKKKEKLEYLTKVAYMGSKKRRSPRVRNSLPLKGGI